MTNETYGQDQTRSTRGNEIGSANGTHYPDGSENIATTEENHGGNKRQRRSRTTLARANPAAFSLFISGKLARQLSKSLESQLTEYISSREKSITQAARDEEKIVELQGELESLKMLIEELDEAERQQNLADLTE
jgi:hypothetical protein